MSLIFNAKMLISQSNASLDEKILFGKITSLRPKNSKNICKGIIWEREVYFPFWSMVYLALQ